MAALTAQDINTRSVMVTLGYHLLGRADHPLAFAEEMRDFWEAMVREQRGAEAAKRLDWRKKPSNPYFRAVQEILPNATAPTTKVNTAELLAQFEEEEKTVP